MKAERQQRMTISRATG